MLEFKPFPKIPRLTRGCIITEKLDGTNAQILIEILEGYGRHNSDPDKIIAQDGAGLAMYAGSRNRFITPGDDNYGFASWVKAHAAELFALGEGRHFGEWWGRGIGRNYGLTDRRFSLFNTARWNKDNINKPACCDVVPVLSGELFAGFGESAAVEFLRANGSVAAPGFMNPEGIIVFHSASRTMFKKLLENDQLPKTVANELVKA